MLFYCSVFLKVKRNRTYDTSQLMAGGRFQKEGIECDRTFLSQRVRNKYASNLGFLLQVSFPLNFPSPPGSGEKDKYS